MGIDIDLMKAVAEDQGFRVEFQSMGFNAALQALTANQVDGVIAGLEGSGIEGWEDLESVSREQRRG